MYERAKELDKTLQEWSEGGDGRGGCDIVSSTVNAHKLTSQLMMSIGVRDHRIRYGYRQGRRREQAPLHLPLNLFLTFH